MSAETIGIASCATPTSRLPDLSPIAASRSQRRSAAPRPAPPRCARARSTGSGSSSPGRRPMTGSPSAPRPVHSRIGDRSRVQSTQCAGVRRPGDREHVVGRGPSGIRLRETRWMPVCRSNRALWSTSTITAPTMTSIGASSSPASWVLGRAASSRSMATSPGESNSMRRRVALTSPWVGNTAAMAVSSNHTRSSVRSSATRAISSSNTAPASAAGSDPVAGSARVGSSTSAAARSRAARGSAGNLLVFRCPRGRRCGPERRCHDPEIFVRVRIARTARSGRVTRQESVARIAVSSSAASRL